MKRSIFLILFLTALLGFFSVAWATVWTVPVGASIQAVINAAATLDGDEIHLEAGTYSEALTVSKSLTFVGAGTTDPSTIITSTATPIVQLSATGKSFTFRNLIIEGIGTNLGIRAGSSINIVNLVMENVIGRNCKVAVYMSEGSATTVINNLSFDYVTLTNNAYIGAYIGRSVENGVVTNSTFTNNGYSDGDSTAWQKCGIQFIDFYGAIIPRVQVSDCVFDNNGTGASSIERTGLVLYSATSTLSANDLMTVSNCSFTNHPQYAVRIRNGYNIGNTATVNGTFTNNWLDIWFSNIVGSTTSTTLVRRSFAGTRTVGAGPTYDYNTIQGAIDAANEGDEINVATGIYSEQLIIEKAITIEGAGVDNTTILCPDVLQTKPMGNFDIKPIIYVNGVNASVKNIKIDSRNAAAAYTNITGVAFQNAGGVAQNLKILGVRTGGNVLHTGVYQRLISGLDRNLSIIGCDINTFSTRGINILTGLPQATFEIVGNSISGDGVLGASPQLAIRIQKEGNSPLLSGEISGNTLKDMVSTGEWAQAMSLGFCDNVLIEDNDFINVGSGINALGSGFTVRDNVIAVTPTGSFPFAIHSTNAKNYAYAAQMNVTIEDNDISLVGGGQSANSYGILMYEGKSTDGDNIILSASRNTISGFYLGVSLNDGGTNGTITSAIMRNNSIHNNAYGFYNTVIGLEVDAIENWWGDTNPSDDVYGAVVYDPWWMNSGMTILSSHPVVNVTKQISYPTIQGALNAPTTEAGDVIEVAPGTYTMTPSGSPTRGVLVNKGVTIKSTGSAANTIIDAGGAYMGFSILANLGTVTIEGFTVTNFTHLGIAQSWAASAGTASIIKNNTIVATNDFMRNGIQVSGNGSQVLNNTVYGASYEIENIVYGSSGILAVNGSNVLIQGNLSTGAEYGIAVQNFDYYNTGQIVSNVTVNTNNVSGSLMNGILLSGLDDTREDALANIVITDNIIHSVDEGIGTSGCIVTGLTITDNDFEDNLVHFINRQEAPLVIADIVDGNDFDQYYVLDQIIYGNGTALYVDAAETLIQDDEELVYSAGIINIDNLRGFVMNVVYPKAYFTTATAFTAAGDVGTILITDLSDTQNYIYEVTGTYDGPPPGITGSDVSLFTFKVSSLPDPDNLWVDPIYTQVDIDVDSVLLYNDENGYTEISCMGTAEKDIIIDSYEPWLDPITETSGLPLPTDPSGNVMPTTLTVNFEDNYNLDYIMYLIQPQADPDPTVIGDFSEVVATQIDGLVWNNNTGTWQIPNTVLNGLDDGTYEIFFLVVDDAGNFDVTTPWVFIIDTTAPAALTWELCRTTPDADVSVDLAWTNDALNPPTTIQVWALDFADLEDAAAYPVYTDSNYDVPTIVNDINPYTGAATAFGWVKVAEIPVAEALMLNSTIWTAMARGYYYFTIYGEDASGNVSPAPAAPFYRESISYWPGDVPDMITGTITSDDINVLSLAWGSVTGGANWNEYVNVGPAVDNQRRSRRTPDTRINIEDLMMFAMNYENTDYTYYDRTIPEANPITIAMSSQAAGDQLLVTLELGENAGFVKGLNIPISYGNGLQLLSVESGEIWPESSLMLHTNSDGVVEVSASTLGEEAMVEGNGNIVTLTFAINGNNTGLELQHMLARTWDNQEIDIVNNPTGNVGNEDVVNVIPQISYLGKNYPNPFNPSTAIEYGMKEAGNVKVSIFNARGQHIKNLVNDAKAAGTYLVTWDGRDDKGRAVSSGIYFFRMETKGTIKTHKALMIK